ncbi:MAG: hypothetical protein V7605_2242 [Acidimicrobiaceae bacterium]|jgi:hypothetical protein
MGLAVAACATLPVLVGPGLDTTRAVEVVDHLVPGLVVLAVSTAVLVATRSTPVAGVFVLGAAMVTVLAGLWMVATHIPLVAQAGRHEAPWGSTMFHSAAAVLVLAFGLAWAWASWAGAE